MGKKNKKDKNHSSFFSNLNANSTIEYGFAETNPKSRWVKWSIVGLVASATIVGVTVPWALSSCVVKNIQPYSDGEIMYRYIDPITGQWVDVTYEEFMNRVENIRPSTNDYERWDDVFNSAVLKRYYNEERSAFNKFKAIYEEVHKSDNNGKLDITKFGSDLTTTFDDIEIEQRKILNDNKKTFEKSVGSDWESQWIKELQVNNIYGPQKAEEGLTNVTVLEEKAVSYMVSKKIKTSSLARYQGATISSDSWNIVDLNFANKVSPSTSGAFVSYEKLNETTGKFEKVEITESEAVATWKSYLTYSNDYQDTGINVIRPKVQNNDNKNKLSVFETKSYLPKYRNPLSGGSDLFDLLKNNFKFSLVSSVDLKGFTPGTNGQQHFTIDQEGFKSLFKLQNPNGTGEVFNFVPFSQLSVFKGANLVNTSRDQNDVNFMQNKKDSLFVKSMKGDTSDNTSITLGSSGVVEATTLITTSSSTDNNSNSGDSSTTTRESSQTINMFYVSALSSSDVGAVNQDPSPELFSINQTNPFKIFIDLLFTIKNTGVIDFTGYQFVQDNWNSLSYENSEISPSLVQVVKFLSENLDASYNFKPLMNPTDYNNKLEELFSGMSTNDWTTLGRLFNCIMIGEAKTGAKHDYNDLIFSNQVGYWTLYKLDGPTAQNNQSGTYLYVSPNGVKIFSKSSVSLELPEVRKMVYNDLISTVDSSSSPTLNYDISKLFAKLNNDIFITKTLIQDVKNQEAFKEKINEIRTDTDKTADEIIKSFTDYVTLQFNLTSTESIYKIISSISEKLTETINNGRAYDFATVLDKVTKENYVAFQTQTKFSENSVAKGDAEINTLFIQNLQKLLTPSTIITKRSK